MGENQERNIGLYIIIVFVAAILCGGGWIVWQTSQNMGDLSAEQIAKKFDCNRITADARRTDVFCGNPKFYNDPDSITYDDYYEYKACDERLKNGPPAEAAKTNDPGYYNAYYDCKDVIKLDSQRLEFILTLKKLKQ